MVPFFRNHPAVKSIEADPRRCPLAMGGVMLSSGETQPYGIAMVQADHPA